ncbi:MAG: hypothetical protein MJ041_06165 [Acidaminococcaceae bacterium]|nr:hypothetical protein [Acidaminococcaceae bacterium]
MFKATATVFNIKESEKSWEVLIGSHFETLEDAQFYVDDFRNTYLMSNIVVVSTSIQKIAK